MIKALVTALLGAALALPAAAQPADLSSLGGGGTSGQAVVTVPWGSDLFKPKKPDAAPAGLPGLFDQPAVNSGPGTCGFAAAANLALLVATRDPADPWKGYTPWDPLSNGYNTNWGVLPSSLMRYLNDLFSGSSVPEEVRGTKFIWHGTFRYGLGFPESGASALTRMEKTLGSGRPFIALTKWNGEFEHYAVAGAIDAGSGDLFIGTWGGYEKLSRESFLGWWKSHGAYIYGSITPSKPSLLGGAISRGPGSRVIPGDKSGADPADGHSEIDVSSCDSDGQLCCLSEDFSGKSSAHSCKAEDIDGARHLIPEFQRPPAGEVPR